MNFNLDEAAKELTYSMLEGQQRRIAELIGIEGYLLLCRGRCHYFPMAENLPNKAGIISLERVRPKDRELAKLVGICAYASLLDAVGGEKVYFPRREVVLRPIRDRMIRKDYESGLLDIWKIAYFYGVTEGWVQQLCSGLSRERV